VFLDRDGVLNRPIVGQDGISRPPEDLNKFELEPGVELACRRLKDAGLLLIVVTNQPDIARGTQLRQVVDAMHSELMRRLPLDAIEVCFHDSADGCDCRKPNIGMLARAAERFGIDLTRSVMVGDRWRDIEAGRRAGCGTVLIGEQYRTEGDPRALSADFKSISLFASVDWILGRLGAEASDH